MAVARLADPTDARGVDWTDGNIARRTSAVTRGGAKRLSFFAADGSDYGARII